MIWKTLLLTLVTLIFIGFMFSIPLGSLGGTYFYYGLNCYVANSNQSFKSKIYYREINSNMFSNGQGFVERNYRNQNILAICFNNGINVTGKFKGWLTNDYTLNGQQIYDNSDYERHDGT